MSKLIRRTSQALVLFLMLVVSLVPVSATGSNSDLILILDASGSMWGQIDGKNKIVIAREVLEPLIAELPEGSSTGLIAYGHRHEGDCQDIETLVPLGPTEKARLTAAVNAIKPKGKTPITGSLTEAIVQARASTQPTNIVLISDGLETCQADPCEAVKNAKLQGGEFLVHVVGFDLGEDSAASLECIAQAGDGLYLDAANADQLASALQRVIDVPAEISGGQLSLGATANGALIDVLVKIRDPESGELINSGRTYTGEKTNPRLLRLPAGRYEVEVLAARIKGTAQRTFADVEIVEGAVTERQVDFSSGQLQVRVLINGELGDAGVHVLDSATQQVVAQSRSYTSEASNPVAFELTTGRYDVTVKPIKFKGGHEQRLSNIDIKSGETVDKTIEYGSAELAIKVTGNGELIDASITILDHHSGKAVAQGRTYASEKNNPKRFELANGQYDVKVKPLPIKGALPRRIDNISLVVGQQRQQDVEFVYGKLTVQTQHVGQAADAVVSIIDIESGQSVVSGRTYGRTKTFALPPGRYRVNAKPIKLADVRPRSQEVEVRVGDVRDISVDFSTE